MIMLNVESLMPVFDQYCSVQMDRACVFYSRLSIVNAGVEAVMHDLHAKRFKLPPDTTPVQFVIRHQAWHLAQCFVMGNA